VTTRGERAGTPPPAPPPLSIQVPDSHCHLDLLAGTTPAAAVRAAAAVGVAPLLTIGIDVATSQWAARAAAEPGVYAAVAVHPNESASVGETEWAEIERLARTPGVLAVGETGLDYYRDAAAPERQRESFRRHIEIAKAAGRTLVIHDRDAHADVLRVLDEEGAPERTVFHCFSGDTEMARACADAGYFVSFAGNVTFRNAQPLRDALAAAPLDRLLVETDAPFLTPMPYRGWPNAPYLIPLTVRALAAVRRVTEDELCAALAANAAVAFGW
jgi:TatD DNase family protein